MSNPRTEQIGHAYDQLFKDGYFNEKKGDNSSYLYGLLANQIPETTSSILEVGPAGGIFMEKLLKEKQAIRHVTLVEISRESLIASEKRLKTIIESRNGTVVAIPDDILHAYPDLHKYDAVIASYMGEYVSDQISPEQYIERLLELVKPRGVLVYADMVSTGGQKLMKPDLLCDFWKLRSAYQKAGRSLPVMGLFKSLLLMGLYAQPSFKKLDKYHEQYDFPENAWKAVAAAYPGSSLVFPTSITGILTIPKR